MLAQGVDRRHVIRGLIATGVCCAAHTLAPRWADAQADAQSASVIQDTRDYTAIVIPQDIIDQMVGQALRERPNEACGLLAGIDDRAVTYYPATNVAASPVRYLVDTRDQIRIFRDMLARQCKLLSIVHSHTQSEAYPSGVDVAIAYYPRTVYTIISLAEANQPVVRAFHIVAGQITEVAINAG